MNLNDLTPEQRADLDEITAKLTRPAPRPSFFKADLAAIKLWSEALHAAMSKPSALSIHDDHVDAVKFGLTSYAPPTFKPETFGVIKVDTAC